MSIFKAVVFDMDGVISHTNPYHDIAWRDFLKKYNIASSNQEFEDHMYGKHNSYILNYFFKREIPIEERKQLEFEKEALFREIYADHITAIPGLVNFIENLHANGIKTGVATSAPIENMQLILPALGLDKIMGSMLAEGDVTKHKPEPEVYLKSAINLGVEPENCVVFEDSKSGVQAGINAGMKVVGVKTTYNELQLPPCNLYINDYTEISFETVNSLFAVSL
ncbi:MAG: HAD family phosphatase [Spirosomataceae bacterium]|jgi:beta-phosphoglucomutase